MRSRRREKWRREPAPNLSRSRSDRMISPIILPTRSFKSETFCLNAHGVAKYLLSRAVRDAGVKVVMTGEGSDEILGGYAHFRRDMLLHNTDGQDPAAVAALLAELEQSNPVSRGLLLPHGESLPLAGVKRLLGFLPTWMEAFAARSVKVRELLAENFLGDFGGREPYHALLSGLDVHGQLAGRDRRASVAVSVVEDDAAGLHPDNAG